MPTSPPADVQSVPPPAPPWFLLGVLLLTGVPVGLSVLGAFGWLQTSPDTIRPELIDSTVRALHGLMIHSLLQWTGACLAIVTACGAIWLYVLRRDLATSIIGAALLCAGWMDAFHTLAVTRLVGQVVDNSQFIPFTWSLSRIFHAGLIVVGAMPFAVGRPVGRYLGRLKLSLLAGGLFVCVGGTFVLIRACAQFETLPTSIAPTAAVIRPWDALALMIYLFAGGILLPRLYRRHPSLFAYGLTLSLVPHIMGETYAAFFAGQEFGEAFLTAQGLKLVGYAVPLVGLYIDYQRVYRAEAELTATREKLRVARELQAGLLPERPPPVTGYDVAGQSSPAEAVGGDWFDYFPMGQGRWGVLVGDVSGHEMGAALVMAQARAYFRAAAGSLSDPGQLLTHVNRFLLHDVRDRRFVCVFLAVIDSTSHSLTYAAAGLTGLFVDQSGVSRELLPTAPMLGITPDAVPSAPPIAMQPGDAVLLSSDGWIETHSPSGEMFGTARLAEAAAAQRFLSSTEKLAALTQTVQQFRGSGPVEDDLTAVIVQRR